MPNVRTVLFSMSVFLIQSNQTVLKLLAHIRLIELALGAGIHYVNPGIVGKRQIPTTFFSGPYGNSIGSKAKYVDIYIGSKGVGVDTDWFITTKTSNPAVPTYMIPTWGQGRCTGTIPQQQHNGIRQKPAS